jgi:hypothetical protein
MIMCVFHAVHPQGCILLSMIPATTPQAAAAAAAAAAVPCHEIRRHSALMSQGRPLVSAVAVHRSTSQACDHTHDTAHDAASSAEAAVAAAAAYAKAAAPPSQFTLEFSHTIASDSGGGSL